MLYGIIATWQVFPNFGRVYAAYGGVFYCDEFVLGMVGR
jgi:drug/metabolite transporter superfamily protein YnfA